MTFSGQVSDSKQACTWVETDLSRIVIQGTVDADATSKGLTQDEINNTVQFCIKSLMDVTPEQKDSLIAKVKSLGLGSATDASEKDLAEIDKHLAPDERQMLNALRAKNMLREDAYSIDSFTLDAIDGLAPRLERGKLGLVNATRAKLDKTKLYDMDYLGGKKSGVRDPGGDAVNVYT